MHGHNRAPARLVIYYFSAGVVPAEHRIVQPLALKAVYWAAVTARTDPDQSDREESAKLANLILGVAPDLKSQADALIASRHYPPD